MRNPFNIPEVLESILQVATRRFPETTQGRLGGFLCVLNPQIGEIVVTGLIGTEPDEKKREKYKLLAEEKARRLALHPEHQSSWESRDPDKNRWGGAIRGTRLLFSFSGLPELWDEALMLVLAVRLKEIETAAAQAIAKKSENQFFEQLLSAN